jgi:GcrA cell cycle regulator
MGAPRVKCTTAQSTQFAALWRSGVPYDAIQAAMEISRWTLQKWRKALDLTPRYSGWIVHTPEVIERDRQLTQLWAEGHSIREIGRRMGITPNAVVGRAHRMELPARPSPIKRLGYVPPKRIRRAPRVTLAAPDTKPPPCPSQASAAAVVQGLAPPVPQPVAPSRPHAKSCIWAGGKSRPWVCCDARALRGSLFCLEHHQRCTQGTIAAEHREAAQRAGVAA